MKKLLDQLGNEVDVGELVHLTLNGPEVVGHVLSITPGSTLGIKGNKQGGIEEKITMGTFVVRMDLAFAYDPRDSRAHNMLKLVAPKAEEKTLIQKAN